jgi:two-component system sensor kinase FixL
VVDNGSGLPDEVRDKLFQPFVSTKKTGMGVGLSICHTIITAHNGHIRAEPNADGGTIFRFTLPIAVVSDSAGGCMQRVPDRLGHRIAEAGVKVHSPVSAKT